MNDHLLLLTGSIEGVRKFCANFSFNQTAGHCRRLATVFIPHILCVWYSAVIYFIEKCSLFKKVCIEIFTQLVTTSGCVHGTVLSSRTISPQVAFLKRLSSLNFGPSQVNLKQYGRSASVLFKSSVSKTSHETKIAQNIIKKIFPWFSDIFC